jgi:hypothetical protein
MNHDGNCLGERDYYKFGAVCQEGFLSSSSLPRRLQLAFDSFPRLEHRALSFLYGVAMILAPPRSPDFRSHAPYYCIRLHAHL